MKRLASLFALAALLVALAAPAAQAGGPMRPWGMSSRFPLDKARSAEVPGRAAADPAAEAEPDEYARAATADPLRGFNRAMFAFNDRLYRWVLRPVSRGYEYVAPRPVRRGIGNVFDNLKMPVRFTGSLLQGKLERAGTELGRFVVNSTVGVVGVWDVAGEIDGMEKPPAEDIGQAFASWGIGEGPFIVLPVFGPTTLRDAFGRFGDSQLTPYNWTWLDFYEWEWGVGLSVSDGVNGLPAILRSYDAATGNALDPYISLREAYLQFRREQVAK